MSGGCREATAASSRSGDGLVCSRCNTRKPASDFSKRQLRAGPGRGAACKACAEVATRRNHTQQKLVRKRRRGDGLLPGEYGDLQPADDDLQQPWWQPGLLPGDESDGSAEGVPYSLEPIAETPSAEAVRARVERGSGALQRPVDHKEIDQTNRGHLLLRKLGWEPGTGLGAQRAGGLLPVSQLVHAQRGRDGLRFEGEGSGDEQAQADLVGIHS